METKKIIKLSVIGTIIGVGVVFLISYLPKLKGKIKSSETEDEKSTVDTSFVAPTPIPDAKLPLERGDKGEAVKTAQKVLNRYVKTKYPKITKNVVSEDGIFGSGTEKAFIEYGNTKIVSKTGLKYMIDIIKKG